MVRPYQAMTKKHASYRADLTQSLPRKAGRIDLLGVKVDRLTMVEAVAECDRAIQAAIPSQVATVNVAIMMAARRIPRLKQIITDSYLVCADGQPLVWMSRALGLGLRERVAGYDLMIETLDLAEKQGYRVFFLGGTSQVSEASVQAAIRLHPTLDLDRHHGYFDKESLPEVLDQIQRYNPHILIVALGSPAQEYWIDDHSGTLGVPLSLAVGGGLDVLSGVKRRAPRWIQVSGLEWLYRLKDDPLRYGRRYVSTYPHFLIHAAWAIGKSYSRRLRVACLRVLRLRPSGQDG
jgi:N-acetylglucosaminyldiphosphoundecaprenol N-acetyl-beta-D-mannosaminyltransferase